jgi:hypothetical protein
LLGGDRRQVVFLFADLKPFSTMSTTTSTNVLPAVQTVPDLSTNNQVAEFRDLRLRVITGLESIRRLSLQNEETENDQEGAILVSDLSQFAIDDFKRLMAILEG